MWRPLVSSSKQVHGSHEVFEPDMVRSWSVWRMDQWDAGMGERTAWGGSVVLQAREARVAMEVGSRRDRPWCLEAGGQGRGEWGIWALAAG